MKAEIKLLAASILAFGVIVGTSNFAFSDSKMGNVAVVDVTKVVSQSNQVKVLKQEQIKKTKDLANWLEVAKKDVAKQTTEAGKQKLLKKYEADLAKKQEANQKDYAKKLANIDKSISATIESQAKLKGYDIVLSKSVVLYGGTDITSEITAVVK